MPAFRVYFDDPAASTHLVQAPNPEAARAEARSRFSLPIRKIKLDRGTVEPTHRAPRLTRRELKEAVMPSLGSQIIQRAAAFAAEQATPIAMRVRLSQLGPVTTPGAVARKMADDMLDIAAVKGGVEDDDLLLRGWTLDALRHHKLAARELAYASVERAD
jgi:hypothetical protein